VRIEQCSSSQLRAWILDNSKHFMEKKEVLFLRKTLGIPDT
jgi:hypothetical protein